MRHSSYLRDVTDRDVEKAARAWVLEYRAFRLAAWGVDPILVCFRETAHAW